jgi:hypothetical protein
MQLKNNLDSLTKYKPNFNIPKAWSAGLMQSIRESLGADQAFLFCYIASDGPAMAEVYMTQPLPKR